MINTEISNKFSVYSCSVLMFLFPLIFLSSPLFAMGNKASNTGSAPPLSSSPAQAKNPENTFTEKINIYFFYEELCGNCKDDEVKFISILQEKLPAPERNQYPNLFQTINIYETSGRGIYKQVTDELALDRGLLETPFLILGGRVYQGYDSISAHIRDAYLTAAEDLYARRHGTAPGHNTY